MESTCGTSGRHGWEKLWVSREQSRTVPCSRWTIDTCRRSSDKRCGWVVVVEDLNLYRLRHGGAGSDAAMEYRSLIDIKH